MKEFSRAEADASLALSICATHVKSLLRRATARNALGKHRAALGDLEHALQLEAGNKQARADLAKTQETLRAAVNRAHMIPVKVQWEIQSEEANAIVQGPEPLIA